MISEFSCPVCGWNMWRIKGNLKCSNRHCGNTKGGDKEKMNNPLQNLTKGTPLSESQVFGWCDNCKKTSRLNIQLMNEPESNKPYTELVCDKCCSISATLDQHIEIRYL
jgi:hypothetical protein